MVGAAIDDKVLVREFVEGKVLSKMIDEAFRSKKNRVDEVETYGVGCWGRSTRPVSPWGMQKPRTS